jgi:hypothetical protein
VVSALLAVPLFVLNPLRRDIRLDAQKRLDPRLLGFEINSMTPNMTP